MSLSDRICPNCEAAPWVIEEVKKLEAGLARVTAERDDWKIRAEEMDGYKADCHALRARVAELEAVLRRVVGEAKSYIAYGFDFANESDKLAFACADADSLLARAESDTPAKPDTEFWQPASTAPENAKDVLGYYQGVYGPCLGFLSGKRFHPYGSSGSEPFTHWARVPAIGAARKQGGNQT